MSDGSQRKHLTTVTTDANGRASAEIAASAFGPPGRKQVEARFAGDEVFNPAFAETALLVRTSTSLSLLIAEETIPFEGEVKAEGRLADRTGAPLSRAAISLRSGDRKIKEAVTDARGAFSFRIPAAEFDVGRVLIQAVFTSSQPWLESSRSTPRLVTISERRPVPVGFTLAAFGATAVALFTFVGLRVRPWERWLPRLRRSTYPEEVSTPRVDAELHVGLASARPPLRSSLKRANDFGFTGAVRDAISGKPVTNAAVILRHPDIGQRHTDVDERGRFALEGLHAGDWAVSVQASGYVSERFGISLPHRGALRHARIDLLPVRERILEMYRQVAAPLLPKPRLWGVWTPRQLFEHVRKIRGAPALEQLTDYLEEKYFSARIPEEAELERAAALVEAARCELSGAII
jgi:hypothetical protein